jgi:hypothetical protein
MENIPLANWHAFASKANLVSYNVLSLCNGFNKLGGKKQLHFVKRKKNSKSPIEYFKFQETY